MAINTEGLYEAIAAHPQPGRTRPNLS